MDGTEADRTPLVLYVGPETAERADRLDALRARDAAVRVAATATAGIKRLDDDEFDCVVVASSLPDMDPVHVRRWVHELQPGVPVVVVGPVDADVPLSRGATGPVEHVPTGGPLADTVEALVRRTRVDAALDKQRRLKNAIYRVARDVVGESSRDAVEERVYAHLNDHDRYRLVWVAEYDEGAGTVDLRIPAMGDVTPADLASLVGGDDPSFVERAIADRAVTVVESDVVTRRTATDRGDGAGGADGAGAEGASRAPPTTTVVVPFVHAETVRGLLLVVAGRDATVDEVERELLADLGRIVGAALDRIRSAAEPDVEEFASLVVHELRNPVTAARGYLELMREGEDRIDEIERALERIEEVLTDELALLRDREVADPTVRELADDAAEAWKTTVTEDADLVVEDSADVRADHALLVRLLANLFDNAVTHGGSDVTVRVGTLEPGAGRGTGTGFYVEDDGPGIPPAERDRVFDPGHTTAASTGLGLAIVRRIADAHGWDLRVTGADDGGARVEVTGVDVDYGFEFAEE